MKVEIRCEACGATWLADERAAAQDASCPRCQRRSRKPEAEAGVRKEGATTPPAPGVGATAGRRPADAGNSTLPGALPPPTPHTDEVVCPRCKLHFVPRPEAVETAPQPRKTVLVVEDLEYFRQMASDALSAKFEVQTARTSDEARAILARGSIDLLVLDLTLDGSEGGRALLHELHPKPCPILIFTAQDESELYGKPWEELSRLGADDLVLKGMKVADSLVRKAENLLGAAVDE
jgi:CheY-like chemotaxis protein